MELLKLMFSITAIAMSLMATIILIIAFLCMNVNLVVVCLICYLIATVSYIGYLHATYDKIGEDE